MAKKKQTTKKKVPASSKTTNRKTSSKNSAASSDARSGGASGGSQSVDGLLKKYQKERQVQEAQVATLRKKIEDLEAKTLAYQEQIAKLSEQEITTRQTIAQLDSRRDAEVSSLLAELGVQLKTNTPSPSSTHLFGTSIEATQAPPEDHRRKENRPNK